MLYQWQELNPAEMSHCQFKLQVRTGIEPSSMTTLPMNGVSCLLVTGTGSGIKHDTATLPTTRSPWLGSRVYLALTLSSGSLTKSQ